MTLNTKLEAEIKQVMDNYWGSYLRGDLETWTSYLPDNYRNIGTTQEEIWNSKQDIVDYFKRVYDQTVGMADLRDKQMQLIPMDPFVMVHEFGNLYIKSGEEWVFYSNIRMSSLLGKINGSWKIFHQHGSYPDSHTEQGEAFGFERLSIENKELRDAVKRRTTELEIKNRELEIEAALERVRARAMAMHKSQDLADTIGVFYKELHSFSITPRRCGVGLLDGEDRIGELYTWNTTEEGESLQLVGHLRMEGHTVLEGVYQHWLVQTEYHPVLRGNEIRDYYSILKPQMHFPDYHHDEIQYGHFFFFKEGGVYAWTQHDMGEEELQIYRRFTSVLSLTYKRYRDLQQAESNAREAQIETALEKVRSRTLAMQESDELSETAAVLFQQLIALGLEPNRLYVAIIDTESDEAEFWITDEDGTKVNAAYSAHMNDNTTFRKIFEGWKSQKKSLVIDMQGAELKEYLHHLTSLNVSFKGGMNHKRRIQQLAYFSHGFIGVASPDEQPAETLQLLERFAYVFNLTFTRFNDLKIAEAHAIQAEQDIAEIKAAKQRAEEALSELQATQKQLIQSEKMASLGELTAGIAHEIQNPLNFVNNFSDVSNELLGEMKDELKRGNANEAIVIADDVIQNLEKILYHGKRADAIVKGMLQHSRTGTGQKELTDINALCDEYLRLAYHGLRAKDKTFNAKFETSLDPAVVKLSVMPQDIGRVILNLINNAFYAVTERRTTEGKGFEPAVSVHTKKLGNKVEIRIIDNGTGIPRKVLDKIFQPFFTTKPTGRGTGLGLSLAYDIIKAHNGELQVETVEGKGTTFIIQLPVNAA